MTGTDTVPELSDTLRTDSGEEVDWRTRIERWVLVDANRWLVAGVLTGFVFVSTVVVGAFGPVSAREFLVRGVSPGSVLVELLKTIVSLVTIVLSINQLVLSPQLGPVGSQRDRLEDAMELRRSAEDALGISVSPSSPSRFLFALAMALEYRVDRLDEVARPDVPFRPQLDEYVHTVRDATDRVTEELRDAHFGEFEAIPLVMTFETSGKIRQARLIRHQHRRELTDAERDAIDDVLDALELFTTARAYLKTIYIRSEFINFSRALLYVGLPCLLAAFFASQIYGPNVFPGTTLGIENLLWFVSGAVTITLVPFVLMISYVSRLATLSQSTLFVAPFVAGGTEAD